MAMYQAKYKKDCEHTQGHTHIKKGNITKIERQMCILDKAESQDITTRHFCSMFNCIKQNLSTVEQIKQMRDKS